MKKILFAALLLCFGLPTMAGRIVTDTVSSRVLGVDVPLNVYLPDGFGKNEAQKYPVIYLLHGFSDDYRAWRDKGQVQTVVDELIGTGECVPVVIIMPNAGGPDTRGTWNGYFNMQGWPYEDFFFTELVPTVEGKYRAVGDKEHRAVMGLSMGGGGSTVYCQRHPDMFSSCYAMSPWLDNGTIDLKPETEKDKGQFTRDAVNRHSALRFVEQADDDTKAKLRSVKWFFDCGDDDFLFDQSVKMHQLMRSARVHDELRIRNGVHNWEYWHTALRTALPFASRNFAR